MEIKEEDVVIVDEDLGITLTEGDVAFMIISLTIIGAFIIFIFATIVKMIIELCG